MFAIQDEITASILGALQLVLTAGERQAMAAERADVRAYEYYLRRAAARAPGAARGLSGALRMYRQAVELDPGYARAYAGIADCHSWMYMYYEASEQNLRQADQASRRALELDAGSAEARGFALSLGKQYDAVRAELAQAIALAPSLYEGHYLEEAARHFEDAAAVRPGLTDTGRTSTRLPRAMPRPDFQGEPSSSIRRRGVSPRELTLNPLDQYQVAIADEYPGQESKGH